MTRDLLLAKGDTQPLRRHWYKHFIKRHPYIKTLRPRSQDQKRKDAGDYDTIQRWFDRYQRTYIQYGIPTSDQYNMDEKGCVMGVGDNGKVLIPVEEVEAFSAEPGNRDLVSIIESISAERYSRS